VFVFLPLVLSLSLCVCALLCFAAVERSAVTRTAISARFVYDGDFVIPSPVHCIDMFESFHPEVI